MRWWNRIVGSITSASKEPAEKLSFREGTAEFEHFIAAAEIDRDGNLAHGACHLANLLSYDPGRPEWIELLERYIVASADDPEKLAPDSEERHYTTEALRAYIWHHQGKMEDAVRRLGDVAHAKPDSKYLEDWALDWLEADGALEQVEEGTAIQLASLQLSRFGDAKELTNKQLRHVRRWAALAARRLENGSPEDSEEDEGMKTMLLAGLYRRAGMFEEAIAIVQPRFEASPSWHTATALGLIHRQKGDLEAAEKAFAEALKLDPEDVTARLEAGDTFFENDRWREALRWYDDALEHEPDQVWAVASGHFCRWKLTGDEAHLQALSDVAKADPENQRANHLLWEAIAPGLPEPEDAVANMLRQLRDKMAEEDQDESEGPYSVDLTVSGLEAPSNLVAIRLDMERIRRRLDVNCTFESIAKPDPRVPIEPHKYCLWVYEGNDARPGLPSPPEDITEEIARLAASRFSSRSNWASASRVAERLGPQRAGEILAVMVHPPAVPESEHALRWLPRVHLAAMQVIAHLDEGWENSVRREALLSVLLGPLDWTTSAAIHVMTWIAVEEEAYALDIHQQFEKLEAHRPNNGFCCWERTLYEQWLQIPILFDNERKKLQKKLDKLDRESDS